MIQIQLQPKVLDPFKVIQTFQSQPEFKAAHYGANAIFIGTMRDFNEGDDVVAMHLEHYASMTERQLQALTLKVLEQYPVEHVLIEHRVGDIVPADPIVVVAVWSAHRKSAFAACRELMEALKRDAPFWKHEVLSNGTKRWVEHNTAG
jgi:molybdopterin synthase catalytic subunit